MASGIGFGTSITFAGVVFELLGIRGPGPSRQAIPSTHMGVTDGWHTKKPSNLRNPGTLVADVHWDPAINLATIMQAAAGTLTITYPDAHTAAVSAFVTNIDGAIQMEAMMTGTITWECTGIWSFT